MKHEVCTEGEEATSLNPLVTSHVCQLFLLELQLRPMQTNTTNQEVQTHQPQVFLQTNDGLQDSPAPATKHMLSVQEKFLIKKKKKGYFNNKSFAKQRN